MTTYPTESAAKAACGPAECVDTQLVNPGPQWDRAEAELVRLVAAGDQAAIKIAAKHPQCETACRYFVGRKTPEGILADRLADLVWWDTRKVWVVVPRYVAPVYGDVPGGWKSDD